MDENRERHHEHERINQDDPNPWKVTLPGFPSLGWVEPGERHSSSLREMPLEEGAMGFWIGGSPAILNPSDQMLHIIRVYILVNGQSPL